MTFRKTLETGEEPSSAREAEAGAIVFPADPVDKAAAPELDWASGCLGAISVEEGHRELMRRKKGPLMAKIRSASRMAKAPAYE